MLYITLVYVRWARDLTSGVRSKSHGTSVHRRWERKTTICGCLHGVARGGIGKERGPGHFQHKGWVYGMGYDYIHCVNNDLDVFFERPSLV